VNGSKRNAFLVGQEVQYGAGFADGLAETLVALGFRQQPIVLSARELGILSQLDFVGELLVEVRPNLGQLFENAPGRPAGQQTGIGRRSVGQQVTGVNDHGFPLGQQPPLHEQLIDGVEGVAFPTVLQQSGPELAVAGLGDARMIKGQTQSRFDVEMESGGLLHLAIREVQLLLEEQGNDHDLGVVDGKSQNRPELNGFEAANPHGFVAKIFR
jgi:hypothetical protein